MQGVKRDQPFFFGKECVDRTIGALLIGLFAAASFYGLAQLQNTLVLF